jgi:peptidoglycan hydrolase CwlO-like protein
MTEVSMTDDLVERLRAWSGYHCCEAPVGQMAKDITEAADEIERLRTEINRLNVCLSETDVRWREQADEMARLRGMLDRSNAAITRRDEGKSFQ